MLRLFAASLIVIVQVVLSACPPQGMVSDNAVVQTGFGIGSKAERVVLCTRGLAHYKLVGDDLKGVGKPIVDKKYTGSCDVDSESYIAQVSGAHAGVEIGFHDDGSTFLSEADRTFANLGFAVAALKTPGHYVVTDPYAYNGAGAFGVLVLENRKFATVRSISGNKVMMVGFRVSALDKIALISASAGIVLANVNPMQLAILDEAALNLRDYPIPHLVSEYAYAGGKRYVTRFDLVRNTFGDKKVYDASILVKDLNGCKPTVVLPLKDEIRVQTAHAKDKTLILGFMDATVGGISMQGMLMAIDAKTDAILKVWFHQKPATNDELGASLTPLTNWVVIGSARASVGLISWAYLI